MAFLPREPTHVLGVRTTADSKAEDRLKVDSVRIKKKKKKILQDKLKKCV